MRLALPATATAIQKFMPVTLAEIVRSYLVSPVREWGMIAAMGEYETCLGAPPTAAEKMLHGACCTNMTPIAEFMLTLPNIKPEFGLRGACIGGYVHLARRMIERGARNINYCMVIASRKGWIRLIKYLIRQGGDDWAGCFGAACGNGHLAVAKLIAKHTARTMDGRLDVADSGLAIACQSGQHELVQYTISQGARNFNRGLVAAAATGQIVMMELMASMGANAWHKCLSVVSRYDYIPVLEFINERHVPISTHPELWKHAFSNACDNSFLTAVSFILSHGFTDTHINFLRACANGHLDVVKLLIAAGETDIVRGIEQAFQNENFDVVEYLQSVLESARHEHQT